MNNQWQRVCLAKNCGIMFNSIINFTEHIHQTHTSGFNNICGLCDKTLCSPSSLDRHMLIHTGERPFSCRDCLKTFTTSGNLHRHHRKLHKSQQSNKLIKKKELNQVNISKKLMSNHSYSQSSKESTFKDETLFNFINQPIENSANNLDELIESSLKQNNCINDLSANDLFDGMQHFSVKLKEIGSKFESSNNCNQINKLNVRHRIRTLISNNSIENDKPISRFNLFANVKPNRMIRAYAITDLTDPSLYSNQFKEINKPLSSNESLNQLNSIDQSNENIPLNLSLKHCSNNNQFDDILTLIKLAQLLSTIS